MKTVSTQYLKEAPDNAVCDGQEEVDTVTSSQHDVRGMAQFGLLPDNPQKVD